MSECGAPLLHSDAICRREEGHIGGCRSAPRCFVWMPLAETRCVRTRHHSGECRSPYAYGNQLRPGRWAA